MTHEEIVAVVAKVIRKPLVYRSTTPNGAIVAVDESTRSIRKRRYVIFEGMANGERAVTDVLVQNRLGAPMTWMIGHQPDINCSSILNHYEDEAIPLVA